MTIECEAGYQTMTTEYEAGQQTMITQYEAGYQTMTFQQLGNIAVVIFILASMYTDTDDNKYDIIMYNT